MTSFPFRLPAHWTLLLTALAPLPATASVLQINVVGNMYSDGRKVIRPTPDKPVYYYPFVKEFSEIGGGAAGDPVPPKKDLIHGVAAALAAQGYRATYEVAIPPSAARSGDLGHAPASSVKALAGPPSLILVFDWGNLHAQLIDSAMNGANDSTATPAAPEVINREQMLGLTAGKDFYRTMGDFGMKTEDVLQGVQEDRYFVVISAYDFNAYFQRHKRVRLWVAEWSTPSTGTTMAEVMPALIKTGAPLIGRETVGPKIVTLPAVPDGKVEVGTPTVVGH